MPRPKSNRETAVIRRMIDRRLRERATIDPPMLSGVHLDEDALSVFIEGRLNENESAPVIKHLVGCAFCRRITAQMIRLETEIAPEETRPPASPEEPSRIRRLLSELAARVMSAADDDAVFAYHAPAEDFHRKDAPENSPEAGVEDQEPTAAPPKDHSQE